MGRAFWNSAALCFGGFLEVCHPTETLGSLINRWRILGSQGFYSSREVFGYLPASNLDQGPGVCFPMPGLFCL